VLLSEYIKVLQKTLEMHDDYDVCITESGYYSSGTFADLYDEPEVKEIEFGTGEYKPVPNGQFAGYRQEVTARQMFVVLGHSEQNY
jgi:hypothetical protein